MNDPVEKKTNWFNKNSIHATQNAIKELKRLTGLQIKSM